MLHAFKNFLSQNQTFGIKHRVFRDKTQLSLYLYSVSITTTCSSGYDIQPTSIHPPLIREQQPEQGSPNPLPSHFIRLVRGDPEALLLVSPRERPASLRRKPWGVTKRTLVNLL